MDTQPEVGCRARRLYRRLACLTVVVGIAGSWCGAADRDFDETVRTFSKARHVMLNELSKRQNIPIPEGVTNFFKMAEAGNWPAVSNRFEQLIVPRGGGRAIPALRNELWAPVHETLGIYEVWIAWKRDSRLLEMFFEPVLSSMPKGSVYFGGTDHGRFVITTAAATADRKDVFCVTQNALADPTYMAYLRAVYGDELWMPQDQDMRQAYVEFMNQKRLDQHGQEGGVTVDQGQIRVEGVVEVMKVNGLLAKQIFEHNKLKHPFFVEESYVIDWMYPYLEPHGLIMKLHPEPLIALSEESIQRDTDFWRAHVAKLEGSPGFANNDGAQKAFAKLRAGIAGIYVHRKQYELAETAFLQARRLYPSSTDASLRLAQLYEKQGKIDAAQQVIREFAKFSPEVDGGRILKYLDLLEAKRELVDEERESIKNLVRQLGDDSFAQRSAAKEKILAFGPRCLSALKLHRNDTDVEIRLTVQELIQLLEKQLENLGR